MEQGRASRSAITRAAEAVEAAEKMFAEEMGATLDLSPAAKAALIAKIAEAIQAGVAEKERAPSSSFVKGLLAKRALVKAHDRPRSRALLPPPSRPSPRRLRADHVRAGFSEGAAGPAADAQGSGVYPLKIMFGSAIIGAALVILRLEAFWRHSL